MRKYQEFFKRISLNKLGFFVSEQDSQNVEDRDIVEKTLALLSDFGFDLTVFMRNLAQINNIILNELKNINYENPEKAKNYFSSDENIETLFSEFILSAIDNSLPYDLRNSKNKLKINSNALDNLEKFLAGI